MTDHHDPLRVLWGSPLPPIRSGVADYALELLPELAHLVELRVLEPPGWSPPEDWPAGIETVPPDTDALENEIPVIHLGNNPHHLWLTDRLSSAVVVVHDAVLHHLLVEAAAADDDLSRLDRELTTAHGPAGSALARARRVGIQGRLDPFLFAARRPFLSHARAALVHSRWAERRIRRELPRLPLGRVDLSVADPTPTDRTGVRSRLGIGQDEIVLMHLGFLTPAKGLEEILAGLAAANQAGTTARLVVMGEGEGMTALEEAAVGLGIPDRIVTTGWVDPIDMPGLPAAADLGVVLRTPSAGETSAAALRFLACGVPVAVGGIRQFLEWPEVAAPRLTPGPAAAADLARILAEVGGPGWGLRSSAARSVYLKSHRPRQAAREITAFLTGIAAG